MTTKKVVVALLKITVEFIRGEEDDGGVGGGVRDCLHLYIINIL
jgi:hypothetical protein